MENETSETFGSAPNAAERVGSVPHDSERFGSRPNGSESFRSMLNESVRTAQHILSVREVARLFEQAGVPRTERSIVNWCQPNQQGVARLDGFFDLNERKYFITPKSAELAIDEEKARRRETALGAQIETPPKTGSADPRPSNELKNDDESDNELLRKLTDLKITNRVKDQMIELLQKERERFAGEREGYITRLMTQSHRIGILETQVHQFEPSVPPAQTLPKRSESDGQSDLSESNADDQALEFHA